MMAIFQPTIRCIVDLVDDMVFDAKEAFPKVEVAVCPRSLGRRAQGLPSKLTQ
jgi:hypothetical protein